MINTRIFVEKKKLFNVEATDIANEIVNALHINVEFVRLINCYDVFDITKEQLEKSLFSVFAEKVTDDLFFTLDLSNSNYIAIEFIPGQFDQRASSAMECLSIMNVNCHAKVKSGKVIILGGDISSSDIERIRKYYINPVECCVKDLSLLTNDTNINVEEVKSYNNFTKLTNEEIATFAKQNGLAMTGADLVSVRDYFASESREPNETEIRMLDTYWSDHCRHTTFETVLRNVKFSADKLGNQIQEVYEDYLSTRLKLNRSHKPITLMDLATINARLERSNGNLADLEETEEINACSIYIDVLVDGKKEKYLLMFKNETHNHPTEIEPFGGASTCLGGAIRDPLSGRSYVYQAMRISGAGDITQSIEETLPNKLAQRTISKKACGGFSSYGNQIGLATTFVKEIFDSGYVAKRMEVGAVVGIAPVDNVVRESVSDGDIVVLLGGKTGRDGVGGATGSSKEHNETSLTTCFAEVQKGNAPEERKLQRLMRNKQATTLIKKANDFGAGGVSVAIGELADGIVINLDAIPLKYEGLNPTEIAISESQERMAVVVAKDNVDKFIELAYKENLDACVVATINSSNRLVMTRNGVKVVDLSREFINTSGVRQSIDVEVAEIDYSVNPFEVQLKGEEREQLLANLSQLNNASQRGMKEIFDSTIGATTVLLPYGGKHQLTENYISVQNIPLLNKQTTTCSFLSYGYNPTISKFSPYHGSSYAIIESITKIVASGGNYKDIRFSFQEYFEKLSNNAIKWGKPLSALLGGYYTLKQFNLPAIGGKDSMSGTYLDLNVPPTLISFAVAVGDSRNVISNDLKADGKYLYLIKHNKQACLLPNITELKSNYELISRLINEKTIVASEPVVAGGVARVLMNMCLGNKIGFNVSYNKPFDIDIGSVVVQTNKQLIESESVIKLGLLSDKVIFNNVELTFEEIQSAFEKPFKKIYPIEHKPTNEKVEFAPFMKRAKLKPTFPWEGVKVALPVFPGTNCDVDTANAFIREGAQVNTLVFNNLNDKAITESIDSLSTAIEQSNILVFAGGFSLGDEPDGSGKFIASVITNEKIKKAIELLLSRNGLILGICNGFQGLIKSGLLPDGCIGAVDISNPTLFRNDINRHISKLVSTKTASVLSPWTSSYKCGDIHNVAISHGEGKFVASKEVIDRLIANGQVVFQYCDNDGEVTSNPTFNPNGSTYAIEGICSPCGRILGKMGHSERNGEKVFSNYPNFKGQQQMFANAVKYFTNK